MTTYDYNSSGSASGGGMADQAQQTASTAKDEAQNVAGVAKDEAQNVAAEAKNQAANLVGEARKQIEDQSRSQLDKLVSTLQELADDLESMARGEGAGAGMAQTLVTEVSDRARSIGSQVQGREPVEVLDQVRDFARRKPGTFLIGALAAGVVAGRLTRATKDAHSDSASGYSGTGTTGLGTEGLASSGPGLTAPVQTTGTAAADPLAGTAAPADPVYPEGTSTSTTSWGTSTGGTP